VEAIKVSSHSSLASDMEINKAVMYLKQKEFPQAVDTLRAFEKKETKVASAAATNLAFIYFLVSYELRKTLSQLSLEI
jgi:intraflagellar transport protein 88